MSIIDPLSCGFAKVAAYNILTDTSYTKKSTNENQKIFKARVLTEQYRKFNDYFNNRGDFGLPYKQFTNNFPNIIKNIRQLNKRQQNTKLELLKVFSKESWKSMSDTKKLSHSYQDCKGCFKDPVLKNNLTKFPINDMKYKAKSTQAGLFKEKILCDVTNTKVEELNVEYRTKYKTNFVKQAKKHIQQFNQIKPKEMPAIATTVPSECERQFAETSVER